MSRDPVCIACGKSTGDPPRLNHLSDGRPCPRCCQRLLEELPPLLPSEAPELSLEEWAEEPDEPDDDFLTGA
jgi:hypothetical protein